MGLFDWTWGGTWRAISSAFGSPTTNYYVTWEYFESYVVTAGLSPKGESYNTARPHLEGKDKLQNDSTFTDKLWYLDSTDSMLSNREHNLWCSTNPHVALIPGQLHFKQSSSGWDFTAESAGIVKSKSCRKVPAWTGEIGELLISTEFIWEQYTGATTISDFIMKVATGVNSACGDQWDLRIIECPTDPNRMMIVDMRNTAASVTPTNLDVTGVARSWGLSTEIPDALRHSIMMSANKKEGKVLSDNDDKVINIYGTSIKDTLVKNVQQTEKCPDISEAVEDCDEVVKEKKDAPTDYLKEYTAAIKELADNVTQDAIDSAKIAQQQYYASLIEKKDMNRPAVYVIPVGWNATLDGMSGLVWGNTLRVKQVTDAAVLPADHYFRLTDVGHSISQTDWTTNIDTALMLKSDNTGVTTPATSNPSGNSAPPVQSSKTDPNNAYQPLDQTVSGEDEEIDPTCLQSAFEAQGYTWDKKFNFFGIRRLPADGRRTNSWTDLLGIWMLDDQGNEKTYTWPATTVPGTKKGGDMATVIPGQYKDVYTFVWKSSTKYSGDERTNYAKTPAMGALGGGLKVRWRGSNSSNVPLEAVGTTKKGVQYFIHGTWNQAKDEMPKNWFPPPHAGDYGGRDAYLRGAPFNNTNARNSGESNKNNKVGNNSHGCQVMKYVSDTYDFFALVDFYLKKEDKEFISYTLLTEEEVPECTSLQDALPNYTGRGDR
tara:strand:- start:3693 stop:5834 length:2142 start_codon:yes stop_codon:yes gene_type:complete